eukprot:TRINITY_DN5318_c0_g1_i1.p1 TRINITY_DN5318_c0_g1~~TRINITY_DN5318_c0_g1_i1.p1  ORF type:complete len:621 (-),score=150.27 TRINITY_DN5318_c0_g1_i1:150-2012(-)
MRPWACAFLPLAILPSATALRGSVSQRLGSEDRDGDAVEEGSQGSGCPHGLTLSEELGTCYFDEDLIQENRSVTASAFSNLWSSPGASDRVAFNKDGSFRLEEQYFAELAEAMKDDSLNQHLILAELGLLKNRSYRRSWREVVKGVKDTVFDFGYVVSLKVPSMPHSIEVGLSIVINLAAELQSGAIVLGGLGETAFISTLAGLSLSAAWVPVVGWTIAVVVGIIHVWEMYRHYQHKFDHVTEVSQAMVYKSRCVSKMIGLTTQQAEDGFNAMTLFKKPFQASCSADTQAALAAQYANTNRAIRQVLEELDSLGRCLYPASDHPRRWSVIECAESQAEHLYVINKKPGVVRAAAIFAEAYGKYADQLLDKPLYGTAFRDLFEIDLSLEQEKPGTLLKQITCASAEERPKLCTSLLASHRAFEKTFMRLAVAMRAYMKTFARQERWLTGRSFKPCRKVFAKPEETWRLCKNVVHSQDLGRGMDQEDECYLASQMHIWKRKPKDAFFDNETTNAVYRQVSQEVLHDMEDLTLCEPSFDLDHAADRKPADGKPADGKPADEMVDGSGKAMVDSPDKLKPVAGDLEGAYPRYDDLERYDDLVDSPDKLKPVAGDLADVSFDDDE